MSSVIVIKRSHQTTSTGEDAFVFWHTLECCPQVIPQMHIQKCIMYWNLKSRMKEFYLSEGPTQDDSDFSEEEHAGLLMGAWVQISLLQVAFRGNGFPLNKIRMSWYRHASVRAYSKRAQNKIKSIHCFQGQDFDMKIYRNEIIHTCCDSLIVSLQLWWHLVILGRPVLLLTKNF